MAFGKTIALRFLGEAKVCSGQIRSGSAATAPSTCTSVFRHLFPESSIQQRPIVQASVPLDRISSQICGKLFDKIRGINDDLLRQNKLSPPPRSAEEDRWCLRIAAEEMLKASQMETMKSRLRAIPKSSVSFSVFLRICCEASSAEQGPELARSLDKSGAVIVLGNVVFLRPDQVAKAMDKVLPLISLTPGDDPRREELKKLERMKAMIDAEAEAGARRELWCGLGFLAAQTAGFIRLTFWELSWDVMEPICFYVTSSYFLAGYVFFMRTLAEPSFEGFFRRRFATKQRKLMKEHGFDLCRFNELRDVCQLSQVKQATASCCYCDRRNVHNLIGAVC